MRPVSDLQSEASRAKRQGLRPVKADLDDAEEFLARAWRGITETAPPSNWLQAEREIRQLPAGAALVAWRVAAAISSVRGARHEVQRIEGDAVAQLRREQ